MAAKPRKPTPAVTTSTAVPSPAPTGFIDDVRAILRDARRKAYAASNFIMVDAYWHIGRRIVQEEQGGKERAEYGSHLIRDLARRLGDEFGNGVSVANLWNFRQFYRTFPSDEKLYALRRELTWTHWRLVMRVEDSAARDYYISECAGQGWNTRTLERNIATQSFARLLTPPTTSATVALPHCLVIPADYAHWLTSLKSRIASAQQRPSWMRRLRSI